MVARRRSKQSRYRGSHTHGCGSKKKARGAGNRGGRGMAGTGKRADQNKTRIWHLEYFGKHGFTRPFSDPQREVTLSALQEMLPQLLAEGVAAKEKDVFVIDLSKVGYDKLLSKGKLSLKLKLTARTASSGAVEKVKAAGGEVTLTERPAEKV